MCAFFVQRPKMDFQKTRVAENELKNSSNKNPHGTRNIHQQIVIVGAKMAPKMDPGGFQKRVRKTVGN